MSPPEVVQGPVYVAALGALLTFWGLGTWGELVGVLGG